MKVLKYVIGFLLFLLVGFFLLGIFKPSIQYTNEIDVNKPANEAFAVMMDESKMNQWLEGYKGSKTLEGQPNEVGTKFEVTVEDNGEDIVMLETITAYEEGKRYAFELDNEVLHSAMDLRFTPLDEKATRITSTTQMQGNNMMYKSMFALMSGMMKAHDVQNLERLKAVIESNTTNYFPQQAEVEMEESESSTETVQ